MGININTDFEAIKSKYLNPEYSSEVRKNAMATAPRISSAKDEVVYGSSPFMRYNQTDIQNSINSGQSYLATAENALKRIQESFVKISQTQNQIGPDYQGTDIVKENIKKLTDEVSAIIKDTKFGDDEVFDPKNVQKVKLGMDNSMDIQIMTESFLGKITQAISSLTATNADLVGDETKGKVADVNRDLGEKLGQIASYKSRIDFNKEFINIQSREQIGYSSAIAEGRIAMLELDNSRLNILQQTGTAMLAQANLSSQSILRFLS